MIRRDRNIELTWQWKSLQMVSNGGWDSSLTIKDRGPGATWQALILMFYLPESGQESSEWSSLVDRHFILLRGQSLSLSKAFSWLCCCTCSSQNHIRGLGMLGAKMSLLTLRAHPPPFPVLPLKSSAPHCVSLTLTPVPLCRLVPFPLTAWLLYPLRLRSQITPPASLPWTTLSLSLTHTHTDTHTQPEEMSHTCAPIAFQAHLHKASITYYSRGRFWISRLQNSAVSLSWVTIFFFWISSTRTGPSIVTVTLSVQSENDLWDLPGSSVVKTPCFHFKGVWIQRLAGWLKILHAA